MAHQMDDYHFCNAELRPSYCVVDSNICCFNCEHNKRCQGLAMEQNNSNKKGAKLLPCTSAVIGVDEKCEFAC